MLYYFTHKTLQYTKLDDKKDIFPILIIVSHIYDEIWKKENKVKSWESCILVYDLYCTVVMWTVRRQFVMIMSTGVEGPTTEYN